MHELLKVSKQDNPTSPFLTPGAAYMLQRAPLLALGTLDSQNRPWTTVLGGEIGFSRPIGQSVMAVSTCTDTNYDPVLESLFAGNENGYVVEKEGSGKMISGLTIDLETRSRVKLYGRVIAGTRKTSEERDDGQRQSTRGGAQVVIKVEQSLGASPIKPTKEIDQCITGNCPKYLNKKGIHPAIPSPKLISGSPLLPKGALALLAKADCFFISTTNQTSDMDTNYRGGPPGFVRVLSNNSKDILVYPEYSGNNLYQSLGNLQNTPLAGLVFPDFDTGDVLYVTGHTEILIGKETATLLPHSNLAIKLTIASARFVESGLSFRGSAGEPSPYNPPVRYLLTETPSSKSLQTNTSTSTATLISKTLLTPTIARFRFAIDNPTHSSTTVTWQAGQYVALDFSSELDVGYRHMRDSDPQSLNDDYIRTFTVSSPSTQTKELEITIRNVGAVTSFLFRQNPRAGLEVPIRGFGGEFRISMNEKNEVSTFIAGGIGITPLLAQIQDLDIGKLRLFWTLSISDIGLVDDTICKFPELTGVTSVFFTGTDNASSEYEHQLEELSNKGLIVEKRRMNSNDLRNPALEADGKWYICAGTALRESLLNWLEGRNPIYESFDY